MFTNSGSGAPGPTGTKQSTAAGKIYKQCCYTCQYPTAEEIAKALGGRRAGDGWLCRCPAHDDKNPSLSIKNGNNGKPIFYCFAGCTYQEIISALQEQGIWPHRKQQKQTDQDIPEIWHENDLAYHLRSKYKYIDPLSGRQIGIVGRYERFENGQIEKKVVPFFLKDDKGWSAGLGEYKPRRPWYKIEKISKNTKYLLIVEGEKCVDYFYQHRIDKKWDCITWQGGAKSVNKSDIKILKEILQTRGQNIEKIYMWPDADLPGIKAVEELYSALSSDFREIYVVDPKILRVKPKTDIADIKFTENIETYIKTNSYSPEQVLKSSKLLIEIQQLQDSDPDKIQGTWRQINQDLIEKWTKYFELQYALILKERVNVFRKYDYSFISLQVLKTEYANMPCFLFQGKIVREKIHVERKKENPVDIWLKSPMRKEYYSIGFRDSNKIFGLFKGWPYSPKQGHCDNFLNFIKEIICSNNVEHFNWLIDWLAHIFQRPTKKDEVSTCIVLRGKKRLGKSFFTRKIMELIGYNPENPNTSFALKINSKQQLTGRFNYHLGWKLLITAEELQWDGKNEGVLRDLVDAPTLTIEPKGRDLFSMPNLMRLVIISNDEWVVPATQDESRFFILDISEKRKEDIKYFSELDRAWKNGEREAFLYFLQNRKIESNLRSSPKTQAFFDQVWSSFRPHSLWLLESLWDGSFEYEANIEGKIVLCKKKWPDDKPLQIPISIFYESYLLYMRIRKLERELLPKNKIKKILEKELGLKIESKNSGQTRYYILPDSITVKTLLAHLFPEDQAPF